MFTFSLRYQLRKHIPCRAILSHKGLLIVLSTPKDVTDAHMIPCLSQETHGNLPSPIP